MRIALIILIVLIVQAYDSLGQSITTANLSWTISRMDNKTTGIFDGGGGTLQSYGTERVDWYDSRGVLKQTFAIREINGGWGNVANSGSILYEAETEGNPCTIMFQRDGGSILVRIIVLTDGEPPLIYEFTIENLTTL